ncbi:MAG: O-antigen ligase family protein [Candidatus Krumholzibacteria bacterium]|nr:O-antigen ligase family protein [Candidatus Krumholzibacteria bacterium]
MRFPALILGVGLLIGNQIYAPNKRVIQSIVGFVLMSVLWNFSTLNALWLLAIMYPFPFAIVVGNSNFVFAILIFIIYLVRVSTGEEKIYFDKKVALPTIFLIGSYILSFYNVDPNTTLFRHALVNTGNMFAAMMFMVMVINLIDDEEKLARMVKIMAITATLVIAFTIIEILFPGKTIVPNWLYTAHKTRLIMKGIRMGGPFHDFELVAEFFAMNVLIFFFLFTRAKRMLMKSLYMGLLITDLMMMFTTITRGAFISLFIGVVYLTFLSRKDLNFVRLVMLAGTFALMIFVLETVVAQYTASGSLFDRLFQTTFEKGVIPTNRVAAWGGAIARGMQHPIIGNGPGWDFSGGLNVGLWPHNVYLFYFNITGILGLGSFLFLLYRLGRATLPGVSSSLANSSYAEGFMKILHVCFVMFVIDQIKIEYLRNDKYVFFIWFFFGMIIATSNVIDKQKKERLKSAPPE